MFPLLPLQGWLQFQGIAPVLPSWYTEYYSQEDRLKALAKILNRLIQWTELVLEKLNELIDALNNLNERVEWLEDQINDILQRLEILEQEVTLIKQRLTTLENKVQNLENRMDNVENRLDTVENDILQIFSDLENLENRVDNVENRLDTVENRLDTVENDILQLFTELQNLENRLNNLEGKVESLWEMNIISDTYVRLQEREIDGKEIMTLQHEVWSKNEGDWYSETSYNPIVSNNNSIKIEEHDVSEIDPNLNLEVTYSGMSLISHIVANNEQDAINKSNQNPGMLILYPLDED